MAIHRDSSPASRDKARSLSRCKYKQVYFINQIILQIFFVGYSLRGIMRDNKRWGDLAAEAAISPVVREQSGRMQDYQSVFCEAGTLQKTSF